MLHLARQPSLHRDQVAELVVVEVVEEFAPREFAEDSALGGHRLVALGYSHEFRDIASDISEVGHCGDVSADWQVRRFPSPMRAVTSS